MCGGRIEDFRGLGAEFCDPRHDLFGSGVGQTEYGDVGLPVALEPRVHFLAQVGTNGDYPQSRNAREPVPDAQAYGAGFAVDEDDGPIAIGVLSAIGHRRHLLVLPCRRQSTPYQGGLVRPFRSPFPRSQTGDRFDSSAAISPRRG